MRALVTGAAGFVGSRLADALLRDGWSVIGLDAFRPTYDVAIKQDAVRGLAESPGWELIEGDLIDLELATLFGDVDLVVHLAARPSARGGWHDDFRLYLDDNVHATQRVLQAAHSAGVGRVVFSSSSAVYGAATNLPVAEDCILRPVSPYGATKLMGESLAQMYAAAGLDVVTLRYFTVYGPGQRPDMACHRLIDAVLNGGRFEVYGDGGQARDFTYVADAVAGTLAAAMHGQSGRAYNLAGGRSVSLREVIDVVGELTGNRLRTVHSEFQMGDVRVTAGNIARAREELEFSPRWSLRAGLAEQVAWQQTLTADAEIPSA